MEMIKRSNSTQSLLVYGEIQLIVKMVRPDVFYLFFQQKKFRQKDRARYIKNSKQLMAVWHVGYRIFGRAQIILLKQRQYRLIFVKE